VHPVVTPPIDGGGVLVADGAILAVGPWREIGPCADEVVDHGDVWLTPGLINAHAHLELTDHGTIPMTGSFWEWLDAVTDRSRAMAAEDPEGFQRAADRGATMLAESGTAAVVDTTLWGVRAELDGRLIPAYEFLSFTPDEMERPFFRQAIERVESDAAAGLPCAIEPHTPYTVHPDLIRRARTVADDNHRLFAIHVSELPVEEELSRRAAGPLAEMIAAHGGDPCVYGGDGKTPVERLDDLGVLEHAILFHGNYMTERDLPRVLRNSASVVYCPRSHRHFGHVSHPAPLMLSRGVNVCLGTDGLVSNEGLDMVEEMLCALERCPALSPDAVLTMATLCGARALGIDGEYGALAPGMRAAFAEIPVSRWPSTP
jgi:cytosine/adenosine deaminase-related metal-dependent hydrolase